MPPFSLMDNNPHRKLCAQDGSEEARQGSGEERYELGTKVPTAVQSFTGTEAYLAAHVGAGDGPWKQEWKKGARRYVFSVTAAGWHTGCLAVSLEDEEDEDYGLAVLVNDLPHKLLSRPAHDRQGTSRSSWYNLPFINPPRFPQFRIGFPARFIQPDARDAPLNRQALPDQTQQDYDQHPPPPQE
ncbi:hypothetical protein VP01_1450g3 [Puccinia sorghi]|uniref:Uncharacterized protein n=1 Tax=Puccinia sorghi TaxID=27349 RepID=A0A0L6VJZ5_9BASI|nr:hypothetical protein VP01_1450g3 [Puccinia sorghi]